MRFLHARAVDGGLIAVPGDGTARWRVWLLAACVGGWLSVVCWQLMPALRRWMHMPLLAGNPLVLVFAPYLAYKRYRKDLHFGGRLRLKTLLLAGAALAAGGFCARLEIYRAAWYLLALHLALATWACAGRQWARWLAPSYALIALAAPPPGAVAAWAAGRMQHAMAEVLTPAFRLFIDPDLIALDSTALLFSNGRSFIIAPECTGIRSFWFLGLWALVCGWRRQLHIRGHLKVWTVAVVLAIAMNLCRAFLAVSVGLHLQRGQSAVLHEAVGWAVILISVLLLSWLSRKISHKQNSWERRRPICVM